MERRVALITGATRGVGLAIAEALAPDYDLLIGGRDPRKLEEVAARFPSAQGFACDLNDLEHLPQAIAQIDHLDVLVHSAGVATVRPIADMTTAEWLRITNVNLIAVAELTRLLLPKLRASHGHVVMINAGLGLHSGPGWAAYSASKFGLRAFTDALRKEERGQVKVTSIHPGRVDTEMQRQVYEAMGRPYNPQAHLSPATMGKAVKFAIEAGDEAMVEMLQIRPEIED